MEAIDRSKVKHKSFTFRTSTVWSHARVGTLTAPDKPPVQVSNPPEFRGEAGLWTPEEMFVAAVEVCHMATFMAYAAGRQVEIVAYKSHANGVLEFVDGDYRFTRIVIFPTVTVRNPADETLVHAILREAQRHCLVANSIASIVEVNPTIVVQ